MTFEIKHPTPRTDEVLALPYENFKELTKLFKKLERELIARIDWLTGQREIENRRADQAEKVQQELEKSLEAARQISIVRAERIQNLAESNDSLRSALAQAEAALRKISEMNDPAGILNPSMTMLATKSIADAALTAQKGQP